MNRSETVNHLLAMVSRVTARWLEGESPNPHDLHDLTMALAAVRSTESARLNEPNGLALTGRSAVPGTTIDQRGTMISNTFAGSRTGTMRTTLAEKDGKPYMTYYWIPDEPAPAPDVEALVRVLRLLIDANNLRATNQEDTIGVLMRCGAFRETEVAALARRIDAAVPRRSLASPA